MAKTYQWYYDGVAKGTSKTQAVGAGETDPNLWECRVDVEYGLEGIAALVRHVEQETGITFVGWTKAEGFSGATGPTLDYTSLDAIGSAAGTGDGGTLQENDIVFVWSSTCSNTSRVNNITGYTFLPGDDVFGGQDLSFRAMYKVMGATPDTGATAVFNNDSGAAHILIAVAVRGANTSSVLAGTATEAEGTSVSTPNPPSVTPNAAGAKILVFGSSTDGDAHTMTIGGDLILVGTASDTGTGRFVTGAIGIKTDWTSGAFDPTAWTSDNSDSGDESWGAVCVPVNPA